MIEKLKNLVKTHKVWSGIIILVVLLTVYFLYPKGKIQASYATTSPQMGTLITSISGTGQVEASDQLDVKAQTAGTVTSIKVVSGQQVREGQILATLDQQSAYNKLRQAQVSVMQAQANYDSALKGGLTDSQLRVKQDAVSTAQDNLDQTIKDQNSAVARANKAVLNSGLTPIPNGTATLSNTPVLSGSYNGTTEGSYNIQLTNTGDGLYYNVSGLGSQYVSINPGIAQPLGNGLYITFSASGNYSSSMSWTINVPNKTSSQYSSNLDAYNTALDNQTKTVKSAQDSLTQAQLDLKDVTSPDATTVQSALVQVESAKISLSDAQLAYGDTSVRAPFAGVVASVAAQKGDDAAAGTVIATVITKDQIVTLSLNEVDVFKVKVGQKVTLTFDAVPDLTLTGEVAEVDTLGTVTQGVVSYGVKIKIDVSDDRVKPGMTSTANIITGVKQNVLLVPNSAVKTQAGQSYVQVLNQNSVKPSTANAALLISAVAPENRPVEIGLSNDTETEIVSGLSESDMVITQTVDPSKTTTVTTQTSGIRIPGITGGATGGTRTGSFGGATGR